MLVLEHTVKDFVVERIRHGVFRELFENVLLAEWGGVGLSVTLNDVVPQGARDF